MELTDLLVFYFIVLSIDSDKLIRTINEFRNIIAS
jgi:hypothetical protein